MESTQSFRDYIIVYHKDAKALTAAVNANLDKGYKLVGGLAVHANGTFYQAMAK